MHNIWREAGISETVPALPGQCCTACHAPSDLVDRTTAPAGTVFLFAPIKIVRNTAMLGPAFMHVYVLVRVTRLCNNRAQPFRCKKNRNSSADGY